MKENTCNYSDEWQPYINDYDKFEYDVKLFDGRVIENCYPNAREFNSISVEYDAIGFHESLVTEIRFSNNPKMWLNKNVSSIIQLESMEETNYDNLHLPSNPIMYSNPYRFLLPKSKLIKGTYVDVRTEPKEGRNRICKCGSGIKFKKCCLIKVK